MQLHALTVTAFGPFAARQCVDFDALAAGGLFLLHGATGAGKTSVLDAVCFAFYGQLPGARAASRSVRSDHAAPEVRPEVTLEATLRGRRLRLTRSPQWDRPKQRGTGTTTEPARVRLEERVGDTWTVLSTRLDETGLEVRRLLGLDVTQFCQVVLLPQGQFAEFLRAGADRRRALLESLFDTERFAAVERLLVEMRKARARELDGLDRRLDAVLAQVAEVAGAPDLTTRPGDPAGWVAALRSDADAATARLEARQPDLDVATAAGTDAWHEAQRVHGLRTRHAELDRVLADLRARDAERAAAEVSLVAARQVAPLLPMVAEVGRLHEALALASGDVAVRRERVVALGRDVAVGPPGDLRRASATTRVELGGLGALAGLEDEASALAGAIDAVEQESVALDQQRAEVERWLAAADDEQERLAVAVEAARAARVRLGERRARVAGLADRLQAAADRDRLDIELTRRELRLRDATDEAQRSRAAWLDLRSARLDGMAAELARALTDGDACPVCGSTEHPRPAADDVVGVTREQEQEAQQVAEAAHEARAAAVAELARVRAARDAAAARAAAPVEPVEPGGAELADTVVDLRVAQERARALLVDDERQAAGLADAQLAEAAFAAQRDARSADRLRLDERGRSLRTRLVEAADRRRDLVTRLDRARGQDPTIAARLARLRDLADHLDALVEAMTTVDRLTDELAAARDRALAAARERGLPALDDVLARSRSEAEQERLESLRRSHDEQLASVTAKLADPALVAAAAAPAPDLAELEAAARAAETAHADQVARLARARSRSAALARLARRLDDVVAARAPVAARHAVVDGLSRLAEGKSADNRLRMSLSAYVLTARLEQVAAAATARLLRMTSGRFSLTHAVTPGGARDRGGLHLRVVDAWTGVERDPSTLSGGESFSASLALALGLADVVTAEAGGSLLETLIVDEGFGSLDDDTLDEVMGVLDDLREGGRTVGLVSHVADLRQRIPVQLHVAKGRRGSTIVQ